MQGRSLRLLSLRVLAVLFLISASAPLRAQSQGVPPPRFDEGRDIGLPAGPTANGPAPRTGRPPRPYPPASSIPIFGLGQMAAAGTIFSGTVTHVTHQPGTRDRAVETVAITFHVERAIRGATPGADLTISEWIGVWSVGQRYRVGDRLLLFLYPNSKLGLTSCIAGGLGRFALDPGGVVLLSAQHQLAFRTDPVLGGKSRVSFSDFASAVRQARGEE